MACSTRDYCISGTGTYDGSYGLGFGTHNGTNFYTGNTSPTYYIFSSITSNSWCLSTVLDGPCLLFGKSPCVSGCPDLCDDFFGFGPCVSPTPTPTPYCAIDFEAIFDCAISPTPTQTPTQTPTKTPTPTPTTTNVCGGLRVILSAITYTPTPTPTPTITPSKTPDVVRPCNFTGIVTFNTIDDFLRCGTSKKFRDCSNGFLFYSSSVILDEFANQPSLGYVYRAEVNGKSVCIVYDGQVENVSGIDDVIILENIGPESLGNCSSCIPIQTQTPTPTPTNTVTPTPTPSAILCKQYLIENLTIFSYDLNYRDCDNNQVSLVILPEKSITICSNVAPTENSNITVTQLGPCVF